MMRRINVTIPDGTEIVYAGRGDVVLPYREWRKIRRVLRAADKFSGVFSECQPKKGLIADVCKAIDALNKEPKK